MPKPGILEVKTGGSASSFSSAKNLPVITKEVLDFLRWLTVVNSACTACDSRPRCEAYHPRCPLFQPHHAEEDAEHLRHHLFAAIIRAMAAPADPPPLAGNTGDPSGESADGNVRRKNASEALPEGDLQDRSRDDLLVIEDVINRTKLSLRKIRYDMASGALAFIKFGRSARFDPRDVDVYIETRRINHRRTHI